MEDMPIMEPARDWETIWWAAAWMVWKAPVRFVERVEVKRSGEILGHVDDVGIHTIEQRPFITNCTIPPAC